MSVPMSRSLLTGSVSPWDGMFHMHIADRSPSILLITGVRSHEAKKIMKEKMKLGDKVRLAEYGTRMVLLKGETRSKC